MADLDVKKLLELDLETRLDLVEQLWTSILDGAEAGAELPLSAETQGLLDERVREDDENPETAISWANVKARLHRS